MLGNYSSVAFSTVNSTVKVLSNASVEVRKESDGLLASIFSDRAGVSPLANPFTTDAQGRFEFYAAGIADGYRVKVTKGSESHTLNNQAVGTLQERDVADADKLADQVVSFHYSGVAVDEDIIVDGFFFKQNVTISKVEIYAREAPTGAALTIDFLKAGVEQTKIATLAAAAQKQSTTITALTYTTAEELGLKIKSVGSTFEGNDLEVIVHYKVNALT